ncbi:hypothetical protein [Paenibacillus sp. FSL H7-0331]|uniref:hypothetical protein n=1 Tax=Paenibacillus sp. FSL H7-0331 TaxID=1920421 RepID=UPI00096F2FC6|nr:hypothetical protein [Paenibacillus sp. FSL H7-0331]OMF20120.1 hypothetical protein BK127_04335 [Paenibacillus sp. FSL H7-0331]
MLTVWGVLIVGAAIIFLEGRVLLKRKSKKEMIVFSSFMIIAMLFYMGVGLHLPIPTPAEVLGNILNPLVSPIDKWMKEGTS